MMTTEIEALIPVDEADSFPDEYVEQIFMLANAKLASFGWRGLESRQQAIAVLRVLVEIADRPLCGVTEKHPGHYHPGALSGEWCNGMPING
jgi:hypothetical protein